MSYRIQKKNIKKENIKELKDIQDNKYALVFFQKR